MSGIGSSTPTGVARMLQSTIIPSIDCNKVDYSVTAELKGNLRAANDMDDVLSAIEAYALSWRGLILDNKEREGGYDAAYPTIIFDEANRLQGWASDPTTRKVLDQLLAFFVKVTKQDRTMNVVLGSSKSFFREWLEGYIGTHRHEALNIGDLREPEARKFFEECLPRSFALGDELWKDVYHYVGGRMGLLATAAGSIENWSAVKAALLSECRLKVKLASYPDGFPANRPSKPCWTKNDWKTVVSTLVEQEDGVVPYMELCEKLSVKTVKTVNSLIEYDLLQYRPLTEWGVDIKCKWQDWPLVMPSTVLHFHAMRSFANSLPKDVSN